MNSVPTPVRSTASSRQLVWLVPLAIAGHGVLVGSRVTVSLAALAHGADAMGVGLLIALYALLPALLAVAAGRMLDRIGVRLPMLVGMAGLGLGAALPLFTMAMPMLAVSATLVGTAFTLFQLATQRATGDLGGPMERARNFSVLAVSYSVSGFVGPIAVGFTIDHLGYPAASALLVAVAALALVVLLARRRSWPRLSRHTAAEHSGGVRALLRLRTVRRVLFVNVLLAVGWDLHTVFVPIYGARIGLRAGEIGLVLASFAAATLVIRMAMPLVARHVTEPRVLGVALLGAAVVYFLLPWSGSATTLAALLFALGLCLGSGQPMVMSLLHHHAPPGRIGEAVGVRMSLVQSSSVAVPLLFGALGASIGLTPIFWLVGACLAAGSALTRDSARG